MSFHLRISRSRQHACAAVVATLALTSSLASANSFGHAEVSCAVPEIWSNADVAVTRPFGEAEADQSASRLSPLEAAYPQAVFERPMPQSGVSTEMWPVAYKSTGADRLKGAAKARILSFGVLWWVDPRSLGVTEKQAIGALLRSGAVIARPEGDGRVYFRARKEHALEVARKAAEILGHGGRSVALVEPGAGSASGQAADMAARLRQAPARLMADVVMLRVEGRMSRSPIQFIDYVPFGSMTILPFGTSFVVHVPPMDLTAMRDYMDMEGNKVVLVGASAPVVAGREVGRGIRFCGGVALSQRFPTPVVSSATGHTATVEVEGQTMRVTEGDTLLIVQSPPYGRGLEVALMKFTTR